MKLFVALTLFSSVLHANIHCEPELTPELNGIEQVSCADCNCVVNAHSESIKSLQAERAATIKNNLAPILKFNIKAALGSLKDSSVILTSAEANQKLQENTLKSCKLDQIADYDCAGAKNKDHLNALFGVSSIKEVAENFKKEFKSDDEKANACFSSGEAQLLQTSSNVIGSFSKWLTHLKEHKVGIESALKQGKTVADFLKEQDLTFERKLTQELTENPLFNSIVYDNEIMLEMLTKSESFLEDPKKLSKFVIFDAGKKINEKLLNESITNSCSSLMNTVKTAICADDRVAQSYYPDGETPAPTLNDLTGFDPNMHDPSYDAEMAEMMDDSSKSIVESSYVGHLFWCSAKTCATKEKSDSCHKQALSSEENETFANLMSGFTTNSEQVNRSDFYRKNLSKLCTLADCRTKPEAEQNACVEQATEAMGESAGVSIAALDFMSNIEQRSQADGYVPYTQLMANLEKSSLLEKAILGTDSESETSSSSQTETVSNDPVVTQPSRDNAGVSQTANATTSSRAVAPTTGRAQRAAPRESRPSFVNDAFRDFMSRIPKPEVNTASTNEVAAVREQAQRSLNNASESIEQIRESYRQTSFDRLNDIYSKIASNSATQGPQVASDVPTSTSFAAANSIGPNNIVNPAVNETVAQNTNAPSANSNRNISSAQASTGGAATAASVPRVSARAGETVLTVDVSELPTISSSNVEADGVDLSLPFQLAVRVAQDVFYIPVRPTVVDGRKILEPLLDQVDPNMRAQVLRSPLFEDYRKYLLRG